MTTPAPLPEPPDFSLVLGGPIFQLFRRAHLTGDVLELLHRRIVVIMLVAWLPLLLLSVLGGHWLAGTVRLPFLHDIEAHIRLPVALPVLIAAELIVHSRIRPVVKAFLARRIVLQQDVPTFLAAIDSATRLRNSVPVELGLVVLCLHRWTVAMAKPGGSGHFDLVCDTRGRPHASNGCRLLVRLRQHSDFSVHSAALVSASFCLVPLPVAGF
jgi:hypothetical protein